MSLNTSAVPPKPCSMLSTPASTARRMPPAVAVRAGGDNGTRDDEQARPFDEALFDRTLEGHVGVVCALGAQIPQRRETRQQGGARLLARAQRAIRHRLLEYLVVPQGLVVGVQEQVRMHVHEAGQQGGAR